MLKFGWGEEKFVFTKPVSLTGQFAERISEYEEKPLTVTAFVVDSGDDQMVLCSVDIVSISYLLVNDVKEALKKENLKGLDEDRIILAAIHTHTGPGYKGKGVRRANKNAGDAGIRSGRQILIDALPEGRKYVESAPVSKNDKITTLEEARDEIVAKITKAIKTAWLTRSEGGYSTAFGRAAIGLCRRVTYNDGSAQMWGDTNKAAFDALEGGNDSGVELMYVFNADKKLTGIVANVACPAQCVQHRHFISPDFWGETKMLLRRHFGEDIFLLALCSAAGDQCPVDLVRWVEPESDVNDPNITRKNPLKRKADPSMFDLAGMKKAGKRLANEIIDVYEEGIDEPTTDAVFEHEKLMMQLPLRRVTLADEELAKREIRAYLATKSGDIDYNDVANMHVYTGLLQRLELQDKIDIVDTEVHIMRLGNIAFATNPFELFLDYGNQIRVRSLAEQTFLVQLANGHEGYLPTEKAEKGGHYSAYVSSGTVGHVGGEQLVRETLTVIKKMFTK